MARRTLLLLASILVAALGTTLVWLYVQGVQEREIRGQNLVPVLFTTGTVAAGTPADKVPVVSKGVPVAVGETALRSLEVVRGQRLANDAVPGQMLLPAMFTPGAATGIPRQRAAVSITISDPHRVPALLKPGDEVAVYALVGRANAGGDALTLVNRRARVMTIGSSTAPGANGQGAVPVTIVGFDVTAREGKDLLRIESYGQPVLELLGEGTQAVE
jgi:pilus assembly protein CpaB